MIERFTGTNRTLPVARGFRGGVGVERRSLDLTPARPESCADHFMRVSLARDQVCSFALRGAPSRKACDAQVETAPKEMHRAVLADEAGAEFPENAVCRQEDA